jgi:zinc-finger of the FCS-type, C2-C2
MSRIDTMARFAEPDNEPEALSECAYCDSELYAGDDVFEYDGEHFCSKECFAYGLAEIKTLGED